MNTRRLLGTLLVFLFVATNLVAEDFYLAPGGSNGNSGAIDSPWSTFDHAIDQLDPGDTLFVRGGTYHLSQRVRIRANEGGTEENPINIWAYQEETPILDFGQMSNSLWGSSSGRGIQIDGGANWLHIKGLTIQNARDNGIWSGANNGIIEQTVTRWNGDSGVQLSDFASHNLILNADSYENYDPSNNGENADGFAIKFENLGPGNVVRGARAWGNSDDGWDMWESTTGGVLVEDSWAYDNGLIIPRFFDVDALEDGDLTTGNFRGDGNGYKLGQDGGPHVLNRVLAWGNAVRGIDVNGNGFGVEVSNSTVYDSGRNWQFDETSAETMNQHILRNNISFAGTSSDDFDSGVTDSFNTWNGISVSAADFLSLDDSIARGPRNPDGSLPVSDFLRLAPGSNLIDAGTDVGLPFNGLAPDLGAYESDAVSSFDPADFNEDGKVDEDDLLDWFAGYGTLVDAAHADGDADEDGDVDGSDYLLWQLGSTPSSGGGPSPPLSTATVPEPSCVSLLAGIMIALIAKSRSRTYASEQAAPQT